jgi:hypothetical protein
MIDDMRHSTTLFEPFAVPRDMPFEPPQPGAWFVVTVSEKKVMLGWWPSCAVVAVPTSASSQKNLWSSF